MRRQDADVRHGGRGQLHSRGHGDGGGEGAQGADDVVALDSRPAARQLPEAAHLLGDLGEVRTLEEWRALGIDEGGQLVVANGTDLDGHGRRRYQPETAGPRLPFLRCP